MLAIVLAIDVLVNLGFVLFFYVDGLKISRADVISTVDDFLTNKIQASTPVQCGQQKCCWKISLICSHSIILVSL